MPRSQTLSDSFFDASATDFTASRPSKADTRKAKRLLKTVRQTERHSKPLVPKTEAQREYLDAIRENCVVFAIGGAGVGKTYIPARYGLSLLLDGETDKIIVTRPMVEVSGEKIGFLPGDIREKCAPWAIPVMDAFFEGAGKATVEKLVRDGKIEFVPFAYVRGRTFNDAFIIADESQNLTVEQFKALITRVGENTKIVISGDLRQSDLRGKNGLEYAIRIADEMDVDCEIFEFQDSDVIRSRVVAQWVKAFEDYGNE